MITTLINFCTNDYPFLNHCIAKAKVFSKTILISVCDHLFNGQVEDPSILKSIYREHPDCLFIEFPYDLKDNLYGSHSTHYWHNLGRLLGFYFSPSDSEYLLFLDADEIVNGEAFLRWLNAFSYKNYDGFRLACYWYFRESIYQAKNWEDTPLLVKKKALNGDLIMHGYEREGTFSSLSGEKLRFTLGIEELPMFHHYSWVRTKDQMLCKVDTWAQKPYRDWPFLVEKEFTTSFLGRDFVHGYDFIEVTPYVSLDLNRKPNQSSEENVGNQNNVYYVTTSDIHKIDLSLRFLN